MHSLLVPCVSDVFILQYTVSDLYQRHTRLSTGDSLKISQLFLELWNIGVSKWLLFSVTMSNSSVISWRDRLQFLKLMVMAHFYKANTICLLCIEGYTRRHSLLVPCVSDVFLLQYTVSDLYQRHTRLSTGDSLLFRSIITRLSAACYNDYIQVSIGIVRNNWYWSFRIR
jgi:hypothetical protein